MRPMSRHRMSRTMYRPSGRWVSGCATDSSMWLNDATSVWAPRQTERS
jgi:hypothetical protein